MLSSKSSVISICSLLEGTKTSPEFPIRATSNLLLHATFLFERSPIYSVFSKAGIIIFSSHKSLLTATITSELLIVLENAYCLFVRTNSLYVPKLNSGFSFLISPKSCN